jgi:dimethylargininase
VFIEDTAVVFDELAVLTRPGALSRRAEVDDVAAALAPYRELHRIDTPGTMDGGDVLQVGRQVFVGLSRRTNQEAARQLGAIVEPFGYRVQAVAVERCLHLKSAVTAASDDLLVLDPDLIDGSLFGGLEWIPVAAGEPGAANVVRVGATLLCPEGAPDTRRRLEARGLDVHPVRASELAKAEGALTCCSLVFREHPE